MVRTLTTSRSLAHKVTPLFRDWRKFVERHKQPSPIYGPCFEAYVELFRLFTFLLDKNGQLNYNIDITEPKAWII